MNHINRTVYYVLNSDTGQYVAYDEGTMQMKSTTSPNKLSECSCAEDGKLVLSKMNAQLEMYQQYHQRQLDIALIKLAHPLLSPIARASQQKLRDELQSKIQRSKAIKLCLVKFSLEVVEG